MDRMKCYTFRVSPDNDLAWLGLAGVIQLSKKKTTFHFLLLNLDINSVNKFALKIRHCSCLNPTQIDIMTNCCLSIDVTLSLYTTCDFMFYIYVFLIDTSFCKRFSFFKIILETLLNIRVVHC